MLDVIYKIWRYQHKVLLVAKDKNYFYTNLQRIYLWVRISTQVNNRSVMKALKKYTYMYTNIVYV